MGDVSSSLASGVKAGSRLPLLSNRTPPTAPRASPAASCTGKWCGRPCPPPRMLALTPPPLSCGVGPGVVSSNSTMEGVAKGTTLLAPPSSLPACIWSPTETHRACRVAACELCAVGVPVPLPLPRTRTLVPCPPPAASPASSWPAARFRCPCVCGRPGWCATLACTGAAVSGWTALMLTPARPGITSSHHIITLHHITSHHTSIHIICT